ncbi:hypothetical protein I316_04306 [Kwoniella heveanensis BCC8398]|uniref:Conserved oligomeric Golgi complex subunit 7 n=1 Tax=Kwoniella heveanensis BCC8398 TaxID=1296120 RepID=A0A1B9GSA9_9TREE|nr:hypothetical protein I316_04306 [Kwoniella heveanensis BCC8398]
MPPTPPAAAEAVVPSSSSSAQPASTLSTLASSLDASHADIPSFLNNLLAPLLPPSLPSSQPTPQSQGGSSQLKPDLEPIDRSLNELLTQLSLLSQDTSSAVEQSIHDVSRTVPRLAYDMQFMRESANGLASSLSLVQDRVSRQTELGSANATAGAGRLPLGGLKDGRKGPANGLGTEEDGEGVDGRSDPSDGGIRLGDGAKTQRSLEKLSQLDKLKTRLESARDILREAESWSTLESELGTLISNSQYQKAGQRLHEASRSMIVFEKTPAEYEDRKRLLISLTNQLELSVSKALKNSLEKDDVDECAMFYEVFLDMDRLDEFRKYYFNSKSAKILDRWNKANILESSPSAANTPVLNANPTIVPSSTGLDDTTSRPMAPVKFSTFLPSFYSLVLEVVKEQVENIPLIFPPELSPSILSSFVQTTFDALDPSFSSLLSSITEYHGSEALPELIRAYKATEELGVAIQGLIDRMSFNTQGGLLSGPLSTPGSVSGLVTSPSATTTIATSPSAQKASGPSPSAISMARTSSKRMSVSRRFSRAPTVSSTTGGPYDPHAGSDGSGWETTLYEPFLDLQSTYATLERRYLEHLLRVDPSLQPGSGATLSSSSGKDLSRSLVEKTTVVLAKGEEAISRCLAFTKGYGSLGLISALEAFISTFFANSQTVLHDELRAQTQSKGSKNGSRERDDLDFDGFSGGSGGGAGSAMGLGSGLDNSSQDWSSFQSSLHTLESCRDTSTKLDQFERRLNEHLQSVSRILKSSPGEGYDASSMTWGSILLLQQSTLNSIDLHTLISNPIRPILPISANQLSELTKSSQFEIQSIILQPLLSQLESYPVLSVWTKPDKVPRKGELVIPTFSLSPTDIISRVSEGLLDLLRIFEVWSGQTGLGWSLHTLPYIDLPQVQFASDAGRTDSTGDQFQPSPSPSPETVLSTWISSLSLTFLSHLTGKTLPSIRSLTSSGQSQLSTDLGYLSNAVGALDVRWEELNRWEKALEVVKDEATWRREMRDLRGSEGEGEEGEKEREIVRKIGWMRGWV